MLSKSILMLALASALGVSTAFAAPSEATVEGSALANVSVSAADAIAAVEAKGTGKVVEFTLLSEGNTSVYHVTTLTPDGAETNYAVDAKTGAVVATVDIASNDSGDGDGEYADDAKGTGDTGDGDGETNDDAE